MYYMVVGLSLKHFGLAQRSCNFLLSTNVTVGVHKLSVINGTDILMPHVGCQAMVPTSINQNHTPCQKTEKCTL